VTWDGSSTPATFNITAGNGDEGGNVLNGTNFLAIGLNNSGGRGGLDVDFFAYKQGVITPTGFNEPVAITQQPASITVTEGQTATFTVGATGTPPQSFQWFENGAPIAGATGSSYSRVATCADNGKVFHVVVSGCNSVATSSNATLTVVAAPTSLQIVRQANNVIVSWPVNCGNFVVEETPTLQPAGIVWTQVAGTPTVVGGRYQLTVPIGAGSRFYRLRLQ